MINPLFDIDWLKKNHQMIHYFGLGFIQLKLTPSRRMHFYTPELPSIVGEEEVHNHRYDFISYILDGCLQQQIFRKIKGNNFVCENETCNPNNKKSLCDTVELCNIELLTEQWFRRESKYFIDNRTFHRVRAEVPTITCLDRTDYKKPFAQVIRPKSMKPVCPFSKQVPEEQLWDIIRSMLNG